MIGADSLVATLIAGNVDTCFANPGTSEMQFVAALDRARSLRSILCLFEGVAAGAADGYGRMADRPAATLLHLGGGLSNAMSQLHNAKKSNTPILNLVGDHASHHLIHRDNVGSWMDIETAARAVSHWVGRVSSAQTISSRACEALEAANLGAGQIATLIIPADTLWDPTIGSVVPIRRTRPRPPNSSAIRAAARALLSGERAALMLSGSANRSATLGLAGKISKRTGARLLVPSLNARIERGAGRVAVERVPYPIDQGIAAFSGLRHLILIGAQIPVAGFAYPGRPNLLAPDECIVHETAGPADDLHQALEWLADEVGANDVEVEIPQSADLTLPTGKISTEHLAISLAALMPEGAIVVDESLTTGRSFFSATSGAPPHDWLQNIGGAIGMGMPISIGAAVACPGRRVICLEGDGSAMYTPQGLWTQAREGLPITTVLFANRSYAILRKELETVGGGSVGKVASKLIDIDNPTIQWVGLAKSLGVDACRAETIDEFNIAFSKSIRSEGPNLIEVVL